LIIDEPTPILNLITVQGTLIIEDKPDMSLDAHYIMIMNGHLIAGTEENPY